MISMPGWRLSQQKVALLRDHGAKIGRDFNIVAKCDEETGLLRRRLQLVCYDSERVTRRCVVVLLMHVPHNSFI